MLERASFFSGKTPDLGNRQLLQNGDLKTKIRAESGGVRHVKGAMDAMGLSAGPPRLPTLPLKEQDISELKTIFKGMGWPVPK